MKKLVPPHPFYSCTELNFTTSSVQVLEEGLKEKKGFFSIQEFDQHQTAFLWQEMVLIPAGRAKNIPCRIVSTGTCSSGSRKNIVDFVLGIFPAACIPELYIQVQTEWISCTRQDKLVFLQKMLVSFLDLSGSIS